MQSPADVSCSQRPPACCPQPSSPRSRPKCMDDGSQLSSPGRPRSDLLCVVTACGVCALLAAACASASTPTSSSGPRPTASSTSTTRALPADPGYQAAKQQWIAEGLVFGGADQNPPLQLAVADLERGEVTDTGNKTEYQAAIADIYGVESVPLTDTTPAQRRRGAADISKLDRFFHIPPRFPMCGVASGPAARAAAVAWETEPNDSTSGIEAEYGRTCRASRCRQLPGGAGP